MEGFIAFIIIAILVSVIKGAASPKKGSGSRYSPPVANIFPPLSVDMRQNAPPAADAAADFCEGSTVVSDEGFASVSEGISMESLDYTPKEINISKDTAAEKQAPYTGITAPRVTAPRVTAEKQSEAPRTSQGGEPLAASLKLFNGKDEVLKAVIYSEIMRPKFKH